MGLFENIKEGDIVYFKKSVSYGLRNEQYFDIPTTVTRTTKTQFTCANGKRYKKDFGQEVGDDGYYSRAEPSSANVFDQTMEMVDFIKEVNLLNTVKATIYYLNKEQHTIVPGLDRHIINQFIINAKNLIYEIKRREKDDVQN